MRNNLGILFGMSALMIGPAMAQNAGPNPAQAAAKTLLQAADKAIGASSVKSFTETATGWMAYPGQQFAQGDLPRSDLKSYTLTADLGSKSAKTEYVRVQGNQPSPIGTSPGKTGPLRSWHLRPKSAIGRNRNAPAG